MEWFVLTMTGGGMVMLAASMRPIRLMMPLIGAGRLRRNWILMSALIVAFILGYAAFGWLRLGSRPDASTVVVSTILAGGGAFVLTVAHLARRTAEDVARIAALERDVLLDPLTGAFNRRHFDTALRDAVAAAHAAGSPLSLFVIDLDHFKRVNDGFGHQSGDQVLRRTFELIAGATRRTDTVARYGGEEFAVIAPQTSGPAGIALAEMLRETLSGTRIELSAAQGLVVTASIGVACLGPGDGPEDILRRADEGLYRAKREGRNRCCFQARHPAVAA